MSEHTLMTPATFSIAPVDDETLARRVRQALGEIKPLDRLGAPLYVQVRDGLVTLRGVVATQRIKARILQVVCSVPGVQQVREELWF
jgi:osmotically-inducible protein OsmY